MNGNRYRKDEKTGNEYKIVIFHLIKNKLDERYVFNKSGLTRCECKLCEEIAKQLLKKCKGQKRYAVRLTYYPIIDDYVYRVTNVENSTYFWELDSKEVKARLKEKLENEFSENYMLAQYMGIKCDNKDCGWADWTVTQDQYLDYVDRPCPCCGSTLLTRKDFERVQKVSKMTSKIGSFLKNSADFNKRFNHADSTAATKNANSKNTYYL